MKFPDYKGYRKPKVVKVNTYITIATYKAISKVDIDMVYIYNSKDDNCILLYYNTLDSIYNILNKKLYKPSPKGSPLKGKVNEVYA